MKNFENERIDSSSFQQEIIENSKEYHLVTDLLNKEFFKPSDKIIDKILRKCDISVSH